MANAKFVEKRNHRVPWMQPLVCANRRVGLPREYDQICLHVFEWPSRRKREMLSVWFIDLRFLHWHFSRLLQSGDTDVQIDAAANTAGAASNCNIDS